MHSVRMNYKVGPCSSNAQRAMGSLMLRFPVMLRLFLPNRLRCVTCCQIVSP
jgi:hypothetical protein